MFDCNSKTVVIIAVIAVAICSALYSRSKEASLSKLVRKEMYNAAMCSESVPPLMFAYAGALIF